MAAADNQNNNANNQNNNANDDDDVEASDSQTSEWQEVSICLSSQTNYTHRLIGRFGKPLSRSYHCYHLTYK